ncbi:MAG TPA: type II toxin-antitoxin system HicA family toxin [Acidobacteriota bacterium]|nr:type II toxin-antitoxin system HicA family toxin [Acidobacteriota bacterium]HNT18259.1 type II toxin-antitoxin system HicA family toxin [Acidobacteriota bacterium]
MKRQALIKILKKKGCLLVRNGARHDWYQNPKTRNCQPVPRHSEIDENLARHILKMLNEKGEAKK